MGHNFSSSNLRRHSGRGRQECRSPLSVRFQVRVLCGALLLHEGRKAHEDGARTCLAGWRSCREEAAHVVAEFNVIRRDLLAGLGGPGASPSLSAEGAVLPPLPLPVGECRVISLKAERRKSLATG